MSTEKRLSVLESYCTFEQQRQKEMAELLFPKISYNNQRLFGLAISNSRLDIDLASDADCSDLINKN